MSNGVAVMVIQHYISASNPMYFRSVLFWAVGGAAVLGAACLASLAPVQVAALLRCALLYLAWKVGSRWRDMKAAGAAGEAEPLLQNKITVH